MLALMLFNLIIVLLGEKNVKKKKINIFLMSLENDQKAPGKTWVQCDDTQN